MMDDLYPAPVHYLPAPAPLEIHGPAMWRDPGVHARDVRGGRSRGGLSFACGRPVFGCVCLAIALLMPESPAEAQGLRGVLGDVARESARIADNVPVRSIDDIVEEAGRSRVIREAIEAELRVARELPQAARRTEAVLSLIRKSGNVDSATLKRIGELDRPAQEAALAIARGGDEIAAAFPDLAIRSRLLADGGPELLTVIGAREARVARDMAKEAYKLQQAVEAGKLAGKTVTVADFASAVAKSGDATITFWTTYVKPHWGKWLTGGALAAYLANPDGFQDAAGNLTEAGFRRLAVLVGEVAAGAIRGGGAGGGEAVGSIWQAIVEAFFTGPNRIYAIVGAALLGMALLLRFRRIRHWAGTPFRWLDEVPADSIRNEGNSEDSGKPAGQER